MARIQSHRTSLVLDDEDEEDRKILARQRAAARDAGKTGRDRAGSTSGRADLESAFDEGAAEAAEPSVETEAGAGDADKESAPGPAPKGKSRARKVLGGTVGSTVGAVKAAPPTLKPPRSLSSKDVSGFALGLVLHALVVSYIRYGKAGPKGWLSAKFLNKPLQGDDLESQNRKDNNNGVDPAPSGRGPNGEVPAEGHMDDNTKIM
jgi:hypothetical protein